MSDITVLHRSETPIVGSKAPCLRDQVHAARCGIGVPCGTNVIHLFAVLAALASGGCSLLLDTGAQQCSSESDCHSRGGAFTNAECVNHVCVARSTTSTTGSGGGGSGGSGGSGGGSGGSGGGGEPDASADPVWGCLGRVMMEMPQAPMANVSLPFF